MKGIKKFPSQVEGMIYFGQLVVRAASYWSVQASEELKKLFEAELEGARQAKPKFVLEGRLRPILTFIGNIADAGDDTTRCDFECELEVTGEVVVGHASWHSQWTDGRFIRLVCGEDDSAILYYDTGYGERERRPGRIEDQSSTFLNLPNGDCEDRTEMSRYDFYILTFLKMPDTMEKAEGAVQ